MPVDYQENMGPNNPPQGLIEQSVLGSRRWSNFVIGTMVSIGGIGFVVASLSSYLGQNLLPLGNPSSLLFVPQGLVIGLYGLAAILLAIYLWFLIWIDFGSGINRFDKNVGLITVLRRGFFKEIILKIPMNDIKAVKVELREGINPKRRISLSVKDRADLPITRVGDPIPLEKLEKEGAELAKFLGVNLEGI